MVADDDADLRQMLAWTLESAGWDVRTAEDGVRALDLVERHLPDVVILDLGMPRLDGYETARAIRRRPWGTEIKLVAHSGDGLAQDKARALKAGFDVHVTKPARPRDLIQLVARLAGSRAESWVGARERQRSDEQLPVDVCSRTSDTRRPSTST